MITTKRNLSDHVYILAHCYFINSPIRPLDIFSNIPCGWPDYPPDVLSRQLY